MERKKKRGICFYLGGFLLSIWFTIIRRSALVLLLVVGCNTAQGQVLLDENDYGPVISASVWYGSRLPGLTCSMPKAHQVSVPICPDCVILEVRPHVSDSALIVLEFTSEQPLDQLVGFFSKRSNYYNLVSSVSNDDKAYLTTTDAAGLTSEAFNLAMPTMPYVSVEELITDFGSSRRVVLIIEPDSSYICVFDYKG